MARVQNPVLFSKNFNLKPGLLEKEGLIDPFLNVDIPLFIDPVLLEKSRIEVSVENVEAGMTDTKEKGKTSTWDWITRILAILAFVISTITTYVTVFQKTTRLSFVVDSFPAAYRIDPRSMSYTPEPIQVVFLNDGTVAAVPFFISISFREIANYLPPKCVGAEDEGAIVFYTDFSVATVPAKGTVARKINVVDSNLYQSMGIETKKKGWYRFPVAKEFEEAEFQMMVCMTVGFVSYANAVEYRTVRLYFHSVSKNQFVVEGDGAPVSSVGIMKKPYQLLSYSDPIWNMFFGP